MLKRLGDVLYWTGSGIAAVLGLFGCIPFFTLRPHESDWWTISAAAWIPALLIWLFGRALRYILAGPDRWAQD